MLRIGNGFDVHRLVAGRPLILCGVRVPSPLGLDGHSDADVALHAITDAILGAIADGDIGSHFPPSQARWKDVDSAVFLRHAVDLVATRDGRVAQIDLTVLGHAATLAGHRAAMIQRLAQLAGTPCERIAIKLRGSDGLSFVGRGEGLAALALVVTSFAG